MTRRLGLLLALGCLLAAGLATASAASAGTVCQVGAQAVFSAPDVPACGGAPAAGEVNAVSVDVNAGGALVITDSNPIDDGDGAGGCTVSGSTAVCPGASGYAAQLGDGADTLTVGNVRSIGVSSGGGGNDTMRGGPGPDSFEGGAGNDALTGGDGPDRLELDASGGCSGSAGIDQLAGDGGDDLLCGGAGPAVGVDDDTLSGGDGTDTAVYPRMRPVALSLDNARNDGEAGESDSLQPDVENLAGGQAADVLNGSDGPNALDGGAGADTLNGGGGDDVLADTGGDSAADSLSGGAGDDILAGGLGPDGYSGGDGDDWVPDYAGRAVPVSVSLDGNADDGAAGERDNVGADVENVTGGSGADTLIGNSSDNELAGGPGGDAIAGGDGNDGLSGGAGRDTIDGGGGRDRLEGGAGGDRLKAAGDGATDRLDCGGGTDAAEMERRDDVSGDCENREIAAPAAVEIRSVVVSRSNDVVLRLVCPAVEPFCSGVLSVKTTRRIGTRFIVLGKTGYRIRSGATLAVKARIPSVYRPALRKRKRVRVRAIVPNTNADTGQSTNATKLATVNTRGLR